MNLLRTKRFVLPLLLLIVILFREAGIFRMDYFSADGYHQLETTYNGMVPDKENSIPSPDLLFYSGSEFPAVTVEIDGENFSCNGRHESDTCDIYVRCSLSGFIRTPLYKSFSVEGSGDFYHEYLYRNTGNPLLEGRNCRLSGSISGELQMTIAGLCSYREARSQVRRKIADLFAAELAETLRKSRENFKSAPPESRMFESSETSTGSFKDSHRQF